MTMQSASATEIAPAPARISARDDELEHWYCCDPNVSFCGRDISECDDADFDEASCVVCEAMVDSYHCPRCGE